MDKYSLLDKERKTNPAAAQLKFSAIFSGVVFNWRIFDTVVSPLRLLKSWRQLLQFPALPVSAVPIARWQIQLFGHIWKCCSWKNYSCWGIVTFFWLMLFCPIIQLKIPPPFSLPMETKRKGGGRAVGMKDNIYWDFKLYTIHWCIVHGEGCFERKEGF